MVYTIYLSGDGYISELLMDDDVVATIMGLNEGEITIKDENDRVIIDGDFEEFVKIDDEDDGYTVEWKNFEHYYRQYADTAKRFCVIGTFVQKDFGSYTIKTDNEFDINKLTFIKHSTEPFFDDYDGVVATVLYDGVEVDFNNDHNFTYEDVAFNECGDFFQWEK